MLLRLGWQRWVLLAALIPIGAALAFLAQQESRMIFMVRLAPSGQRLAISKCALGARGEFVRGTLEIWDLDTGALLVNDNRLAAAGWLAFSPDSNTLAVGGGATGEVALWDVDSRRRKEVDTVSPYAPWLFFDEEGKTLFYRTIAAQVKLRNVRTEEVSEQTASFGQYQPPYAQQLSRLATISRDNTTREYEATILDLADGRFQEVSSFLIPHGEPALSQDGQQLAVSGTFAGVYNGPNLRFYDTESGQLVRSWSLGFGVYRIRDNANGLAFSPDGKLLATVDPRCKIHLWNVATGKSQNVLRATEGVPLFSVQFLPDGKSLVTVSETGAIAISSLDGGHRQVTSPPRRWWPLWRSVVAVALVLWGLVWVRTRTRPPIQSFRPLGDVLLLHALVPGTFLLRILTTGAMNDVARPEAILVAAGACSLVSLLLLWFMFGAVRWSLRAAGFFAGFGITWGLGNYVWQNPAGADPHLLIVALCMLSCLFPLLAAWRSSGARLLHIGDDESSRLAIKGRCGQFQLRDALLWSAAAALILAAGQTVVLSPIPLRVCAYLATVGCSTAITVAVALGVGLGSVRGRFRFSLPYLTAALCGSVPHLVFGTEFTPAWWCYIGLHMVTASLILISLSVFRLHGYRLFLRESARQQESAVEASR